VEQLLLTLFVLFAATCTDCKSSHNRLVFVLIFALLEIMYQGDLAYENCHIWFTCLHSFRSHMLDSRPFRSRANSLPGANRPIGPWPIRSLEFSLLGLFALWPFRSPERNGQGTFVPWNFRTQEYSLPGTFAPWNFRSPLVRDMWHSLRPIF